MEGAAKGFGVWERGGGGQGGWRWAERPPAISRGGRGGGGRQQP